MLIGALALPSAAFAQPAAPAAPPAAPEAPALPAAPGEAKAPAAPGKRWEARTPAVAGPPVCHDVAVKDQTLDAALRAFTFELASGRKPLHDVRIVGLKTLAEADLWPALGGRPAKIDAGRAAFILRQLSTIGLFASLTPVIDLRAPEGPVLVVTVVEHPTVNKVVFEGLHELEPEPLLRALFEAPSRGDSPERQARKAWEKWLEKRPQIAKVIAEATGEHDDDDDDDDERGPPCPDARPMREWVARTEGQVVFPGIAWKGLQRGLERVLGRLFDKGYEMASMGAQLGPDGTLTVRIDEGTLARVDVVGVHPNIEAEVRALIGLEVGKPFVRSDLDRAASAVRAQFPFLREDGGRNRPTRARPKLVARPREGGGEQWVSEEAPPRKHGRWFAVAGHDLTLHFRARYFEKRGELYEILRHTPVTSFAPGLEGTMFFWDPGNRVHGRVGLAGGVNTKRARAAAIDATTGERERWRFDWQASGSVLVPALRLAELGVTGYARVDTADRWRISRVDSYLYSLLMNRPDSDYFRRTGLTAFATFHVFDRLTAGVEYRRDRYQSLSSADKVFTLFNRDEAAYPTALVDDLTIGSLLFRLEFATEPAPLHKVGGLRRDPERPIVERPGGRWSWAEARSMNTLEVASDGLGSSSGVNFVRLVSDSSVFLRLSSDSGFKLRFRAAGRLDGTLPVQKQEALGGWSAVRGYGFKEQRGGDFSLLGTAEYRMEALSAFVDMGSLRSAGSFADPLTGFGLALNMGDRVHLDLAWRTDDQARFRPEIRLFFHRTF